MPYLLNALYLTALVLLSPWLIYKALTTGKYRRGMWRKLTGRVDFAPAAGERVVWFHGVSVGEIHLLRQVVASFRKRHPELTCVISTTTDTGYEEARKHFADLPVVYWPLDFTWAVKRALHTVNPELVVLAEGEVWPNFLLAAKKQGIPVAIINGRMSPRSTRHYAWLGKLGRWLFGKIDLLAVQTEEYASNYRALGAAPDRVQVTGNVKYDGVAADRNNPKTRDLARLFQVQPGETVWVAGSTQAPEEEITLAIYERVRDKYPNLRLFLVPRQKDRFEEVAQLLERSGLTWLRRSSLRPDASRPTPHASRPPIVLVDTIGELAALWGLADLAFVGGSMDGRRGGQNMIEPAAYGAAVVFGPHVWNFKDTSTRLVKAGAALQVDNAAMLELVVRQLLGDAELRASLGAKAQAFVQAQQGATERTLDLLDALVNNQTRHRYAA